MNDDVARQVWRLPGDTLGMANDATQTGEHCDMMAALLEDRPTRLSAEDLMTEAEVRGLFRVSARTFARRLRDWRLGGWREFPPPIAHNKRFIRWRRTDIVAYVRGPSVHPEGVVACPV
jgi:hypothetical protein